MSVVQWYTVIVMNVIIRDARCFAVQFFLRSRTQSYRISPSFGLNAECCVTSRTHKAKMTDGAQRRFFIIHLHIYNLLFCHRFFFARSLRFFFFLFLLFIHFEMRAACVIQCVKVCVTLTVSCRETQSARGGREATATADG